MRLIIATVFFWASLAVLCWQAVGRGEINWTAVGVLLFAQAVAMRFEYESARRR